MTTATSSKRRSLFDVVAEFLRGLPPPVRVGRPDGPRAEAVLLITPKPMPRPRVTSKGITFYPADYKRFERELDAALRASIAHGPDDGTFAVLIEAVCPPLKTVVREAPVGDVDNFAKPVLDRITKLGLIWHDDRQVMSLVTTKRFAGPGEVPHYHVVVTHLT